MSRVLIVAVALTAMLPAAAQAHRRDRNHDRIPDRWEARHHLSTQRNVAHRDPDHDGLSNLSEYRHHTNPRSADTDRDGVKDGAEVRQATNPRSSDSNGDGVKDGAEMAGRVTGWDGTTLTITLNDGSSATGAVTDASEIGCEDRAGNPAPPAPTTATRSSLRDDGGSDGRDEGTGDQSGNGQSEPGDDNGGQDDAGDGNGKAGNCSTSDLAVGTFVHSASLKLTSAGPVFEEVELVK